MNKLTAASKYIWKNLLWVPFAAWIVGSSIMQAPKSANAFDPTALPSGIIYSGPISTDTVTVLTTTKTITVDLMDKQFNSLSAQVTWSSYSVNSISFNDGNASTSTITIASNTALAAATSWITITVASNTALAGATAYVAIVISSNTALKGAQITFTQTSTPFEIGYSSYQAISSSPSEPYVTYSTPTPPSVATIVSSYTFIEGRDWYRSNFPNNTLDCASMTAISIANALNFSTYGVTASTGNISMPVTITTGTNIVIVRAINAGKYANSWSIQSSTQFAMTVTYSTAGNGTPNLNQFASTPCFFTGGQDPAFVTVTSTWTYRLVAGRDWAVDPFVQGSSATAQNLAVALNASSQSINGIQASTAMCVPLSNFTGYTAANNFLMQFSTTIYSPSVVIVQAVRPGTAQNAWTIASSTQFGLIVAYSTGFQNGTPNPAFTLARSTPLNFNGGLDPAYIKVNGVRYTNGIDWFTGSVASATAFSLSSAMNLNVRTSSTNVIVTTCSMFTTGYSVIYCTSTSINHNEYNLYTSSQFALSISTDPMGFSTNSVNADGSSTGSFKGGFASQFDTNTFTISTFSAIGYRWANNMAVLFSTVAASQVPPGALVNGSTYFVTAGSQTALSSRSFSLANTSSGALANIPWSQGLSTRSAQGGNIYTISQLPWTPTAGVVFQFSNDNLNWIPVSGTSITINTSSLGNGSTYYDFGQATNGRVNFRYLREVISSSSTTPSTVNTNIYGKY